MKNKYKLKNLGPDPERYENTLIQAYGCKIEDNYLPTNQFEGILQMYTDTDFPWTRAEVHKWVADE